ncbi:T6SS immunity protein Tli4 family protein [Arhodomonas aquaeolei]|uniref:T6SS immunity protein Tli4 family protein n=1 Tax=Arhodomonas aquaeolei TaxID=2369 RepID=UPI002169756F|nr:T6SS immunity protein Tli4 family protein [Arhodomonas aquaeolei]MCS4504647.1 T6SS immunity protein Tli4 family protein [Arhodomonas aquaeolei]
MYGEYDFAIGYVHDPIGTWTLKNAYAADYRWFAERIEFRREPGEENLPEGRGYCIMYGFIPETSPTGNEWEERYFKMRDDPNFSLTIRILNIGERLETVSELEENWSDTALRFITTGDIWYEKKAEPVSLGFIDGEESIVGTREPMGRSYNLIAQGNGSDPEHPSIQVSMESGDMPKEEADRLWYSILGSLHPRPGAF